MGDRQTLSQALPHHIRHREPQRARPARATGRRLTGIEQRQDVRVLELGGDGDLAPEALRPDGRGQLGVEHLERHQSAMLGVFGQIHRGHPASADLALDPIARAQSSLKLRRHI